MASPVGVPCSMCDYVMMLLGTIRRPFGFSNFRLFWFETYIVLPGNLAAKTLLISWLVDRGGQSYRLAHITSTLCMGCLVSLTILAGLLLSAMWAFEINTILQRVLTHQGHFMFTVNMFVTYCCFKDWNVWLVSWCHVFLASGYTRSFNCSR